MKKSILIFNTVMLVFYSSLTTADSETRQSGKIFGQGTEKIKLELSEPRGGWTVNRMIEVSGTISDESASPVTVSINGDRYLLRAESGLFKRKFPAKPGKNTVVVQATNKAGTVKTESSVFAKISSVPLMAVLTSDTDGVYTDLHIYEPSPRAKDPLADPGKEGAHVYWASVNSPTGGKFYLNEQGDSFDQPGYGPYLYTHSSPPIGIFRIDANYWPSGDKAHTLGTLNMVLYAGEPGEIRKLVRAPLAKPGETVTLAWVRVDKGRKAHIYSPVMDKKPENYSIWPKWVLDYKPKKNEGYESDY